MNRSLLLFFANFQEPYETSGMRTYKHVYVRICLLLQPFPILDYAGTQKKHSMASKLAPSSVECFHYIPYKNWLQTNQQICSLQRKRKVFGLQKGLYIFFFSGLHT